jgi:CRP/FNR family cyclic AMP-dependent transcriptional regulator
MSITESVLQVPLFSHLDENEASRLGQATRKRNYPKNSVILFEDDPGDALFIVVSGQVKVVLIGEDGREVILSVLGHNDFFGEMSLLDDEPRSAHVIAMEDSELLVLRRDDFQRCLEETPRIALGLLRALSRRLRRADDKIGGLVLLDVTGRVARLLIEFAEESASDTILRKVTHHTIAQMIGSSRETVSRTMRDLVDRKMITVAGKSITIVARGDLRKIAGLR